MSIPHWLTMAIATYGYWAILVAVALETMGVPFPGETSLLAGAVYAGTGGPLNIIGVIAAAAVGAILGDNIGFTVGYFGGYPLLRRLARLLHIDEAILRYAQRFFEQHGNKTVLIGRFFSILRTWVAFLAGVNRMPRRVFFFWNATGGILWAITYGLLGYYLGRNLPVLNGVLNALGISGAVVIAGFVALVVGLWVAQRRRAHAAVRGGASPTADEVRSATDGAPSGTAADPMRSGATRQTGSPLAKITAEREDAAAGSVEGPTNERTTGEWTGEEPADARGATPGARELP